MIANSGRFHSVMPLILGDQPFNRFLRLSDWLYDATGQLSRISLKRLFELLRVGLVDALACDAAQIELLLLEDYRRSGIKGMLSFQKDGAYRETVTAGGKGSVRQKRHVRGDVVV